MGGRTLKLTGIISAAILSLLCGIAAPVYAQHEQKDEKQGHPAEQQSRPQQAKPAQQRAQQPQRAQQQRQAPQERAQQPQRQQPNNRQEHAQQQSQQPQQRAQQSQRQQPNNRQEHAQQQRQQPQQRAQQPQRQQPNNRQEHAQQARGNGNEHARGTPEQHRVQQSAWRQHGSQHWDADHRTWQQRGGYNGYRVPEDRYRGYFGPDHGFRIGGLPFLVVGGYPRFQYDGYWISAVDPWPEYWGENWYDNDDVYVAYVDNGYYMYNRRYPHAGVAISISF